MKKIIRFQFWIKRKNTAGKVLPFLDVGLLYQTSDFSGKLIENNREGNLFWKDYDEFKKMDKMSDSMPEILKIYDGKYREIYWDVDKDRKDYY